jgi:hypothetical protein
VLFYMETDHKRRPYVQFLYETFKITNMTTSRKYYVLPENVTVVRICTRENLSQKWDTKFYNH